MLTPELLDAYLVTHYRVDYSAGAFILRIGQQSAELLALFQEKAVSGAAFITAWNPHSQPTSHVENMQAQRCLLDAVQRMGYESIPGMGVDPAGKWPGEASALILGLERTEAVRLGRTYAQNAIVWCGEDAIPQLLMCH